MSNLKQKVVEELSKVDRVKLISHTDCDGICSALLMAKFLKMLHKDFFILFSSPEEASKGKLANLATASLNLVLDIPILECVDKFKSKVILIDHHEYEPLNGSEKLILIHPKLMRIQVYCPTSMLLFLLFDELSSFDYIACIGCIGDGGGKWWSEIIRSSLMKYGLKEGKDEFDNEFGRLAQIIGSAKIYRGVDGVNEIFFELIRAENFPEFRERVKKFEKWYEAVERKLKRLEKEFLERSEEYGDVELRVFYMKNQGHGITSALATRLSYKYPNTTILICNEKKGKIGISLRRNDGKINLIHLLKRSLINLRASGGGHTRACGGIIHKSDFELFKLNFLKNLREIYGEREEEDE